MNKDTEYIKKKQKKNLFNVNPTMDSCQAELLVLLLIKTREMCGI